MDIVEQLKVLGFQRAAVVVGRELRIEADLKPEPAVYVAVLDGEVFWVGETGNARGRFGQYRQWLALPDDSGRRDRPTRDRLLEMTGGAEVVFFVKPAMTVWSELMQQHYPAHRLEETILIDYFQPVWNHRPGGRSRG